MNNATMKALKTWYKFNHPLYQEQEPALLGLAGEIGEVLDLYKKQKYKPDFDWMMCKWCNQELKYHTIIGRVCCDIDYQPLDIIYLPIVIDELGDIWWYLRIMAWLNDAELIYLNDDIEFDDLECIAEMYRHAAKLLGNDEKMIGGSLQNIYYYLNVLLTNLGYTIEELTELNYQKLNSDNNHGWRDA